MGPADGLGVGRRVVGDVDGASVRVTSTSVRHPSGVSWPAGRDPQKSSIAPRHVADAGSRTHASSKQGEPGLVPNSIAHIGFTSLGDTVGFPDGRADGAADGAGVANGDAVGLAVGNDDGASVIPSENFQQPSNDAGAVAQNATIFRRHSSLEGSAQLGSAHSGPSPNSDTQTGSTVVGKTDGDALGAIVVGLGEGAADGLAVGDAVGDPDGLAVGDAVGAPVSGAMPKERHPSMESRTPVAQYATRIARQAVEAGSARHASS